MNFISLYSTQYTQTPVGKKHTHTRVREREREKQCTSDEDIEQKKMLELEFTIDSIYISIIDRKTKWV